MAEAPTATNVYVHPQALCEATSVGENTRVWAFAHVLPGATIGKDCNICDHVFIENDVVIGDRVTVKCGVQLWDGLRVADDVFIGPNVTFSNDKYPKSKQYQAKVQETHIGRGASIGGGAAILPGLRIGARAMSRWARVVVGGVAVLTAMVLVVDALVSLASGTYLNLGSGVWLALARDTHDGVFYRPLWNGSEYGGTRYFPMLFLLSAGVMRTGVNAVTAGVTVSMAGLVMLATAVAVLLKRLAVPSPFVLLGTALSIAPYFVHQTAFAVRCEPIAAAFAIFGLAALTPLEMRAASNPRLLIAATLFVAAFMTKITCVYAPAAATMALLFARRPAAAIKLGTLTAAGALLALGMIGSAYLNPVSVDPNWRIVGSGDFNGDGKADLVWQHTNGSLAVWYMNGVTAIAGEALNPGQIGYDWKIMKLIDPLNAPPGDTRAMLLIRYSWVRLL